MYVYLLFFQELIPNLTGGNCIPEEEKTTTKAVLWVYWFKNVACLVKYLYSLAGERRKTKVGIVAAGDRVSTNNEGMDFSKNLRVYSESIGLQVTRKLIEIGWLVEKLQMSQTSDTG